MSAVKTFTAGNMALSTRALHFSKQISKFRTASTLAVKAKAPCTTVGRDIIDLNDWTGDEIKNLLWTALDLKDRVLKKKTMESQSWLNGRSVAVLLARPCIKTQLSVPLAASLLGAQCNVFVDNWEKSHNVCDIGRFVSAQADVVFTLGDSQCNTKLLADGSISPVVSVLSDRYAPVKCLVDLFTLVEHFGRLRKLTMGYSGLPGQIFKTYLTSLPRLGMDLKFNAGCSQDISEELDLARKYSKNYETCLHQYFTTEEAMDRVDIIATAYHEDPELCITDQMANEASVDWVFLHSLPRTPLQVSDGIFNNCRSLVWKSVSNTTWVAMAIILQLLKDFEPKIKRPDFEGNHLEMTNNPNF